MGQDHTEAIARLNNAFRKSAGVNPPSENNRVIMTQGVAALPDADIAAIVEKVRDSDQFDEDNDPYGEHDFGTVEHNGETIFWKIEYYDPNPILWQRKRGRSRPNSPCHDGDVGA